MEILSPSILLKMTASVTSFSGNDFPNWLHLPGFVNCVPLSSKRKLLCGNRKVFMVWLERKKPFRSWSFHPQDVHSPQYEPSSKVIHPMILSLLWHKTSSSYNHSQDLAVNHFLSPFLTYIFDLHFLNLFFFFITMSMNLERKRLLKGSYHVPKIKETKQKCMTMDNDTWRSWKERVSKGIWSTT